MNNNEYYRQGNYEVFTMNELDIARSLYPDGKTPEKETTTTFHFVPFPKEETLMNKIDTRIYTPNGKLQKKIIFEDNKPSVIEFYDAQEQLMDKEYIIEGEKLNESTEENDYYRNLDENISLSELEIIGLLLKHIQRIIPQKTKAREEILSTLKKKAIEAKKQEERVPTHTQVWSEERQKRLKQAHLEAEQRQFERQEARTKMYYQFLGLDQTGHLPLSEAEKRVLFYMEKSAILTR